MNIAGTMLITIVSSKYQINGMTLSEEIVRNFNPGQLKTIESILKTIVVKENKKVSHIITFFCFLKE